MRNNKFIRVISMTVIALMLFSVMLISGGCSITDNPGFTVDLHTRMEVSGDFRGVRIMTVSFDKSLVLSGLESMEKLESLVESYLPDCLDGELIDDENGTRYKLTLEFSSMDDYVTKIESLLGRKPTVVFETSDEVFMKGLTFQEDFESKELFSFVDVNSVVSGFVSNADISESDIQVAAAFIKQTGVLISVDDKEYQSEGGKVDVTEGKATMISKVSFKTVLKSTGYIERTIEFRMIPEIDQNRYTEIITYFESVKPETSEVRAGELSSSPVISVQFKSRDAAEMAEKTSQILGDVCTAEFADATDASIPFASVEKLSEYISFSKLCLDSQMPFSYNVVSEIGSPSSMVVEIDGTAVDSQPTLGGNTLDYGSQASYVSISTGYQSISTASLVYYNLIAHGDDEYTREIYIIMDDATSTEVLENIKAYYDSKNSLNTEINVLLNGFSEAFTSPCVEISIHGNAKEIIRAEDMLFGGATERKITYSRDKSIINTSPNTTLCDVYDISSLLSMTNVTSYYYAFVSDDELRSGAVETALSSYSVEVEDNYLGFMMSDGTAKVIFIGGYTNTDAIIFIILLVLFIILLLVLAAILVFKYLKAKAGEGEEPEPEKKEPFPVEIQEEPEEVKEEEPVVELPPPPPPVRDLTAVLDEEEEPEAPIEIEVFPPTTPEPVIIEVEEPEEEKPEAPKKVTIKPIIPIYAVPQPEEEPESEPEPAPEPVVIPAQEPEERFDERNRAPEVPFERSPFEEEYDREFAEAEMAETEKADTYTDQDMLDDLEALGLLDEYIERTSKVKIKVKKHKKD